MRTTWLWVLLLAAGCASAPAKKDDEEGKRKEKITFEEMARRLHRLPEVVRASGHRQLGHDWRTIAYSTWKREKQREALDLAIQQFHEAIEWYYLAKDAHPEYGAYLDEEIDAVYGFLVRCLFERPPMEFEKQKIALEQMERREMYQKLEALNRRLMSLEGARGGR